jgi:hypothetical protein
MSYQLQIARREWSATGETLTVTPIAPTATLFEYFPAAAPSEVIWSPGEPVGAWPVSHRVLNVTEHCRLRFVDVMAGVRALNQAFAVARLWAESARRDLEIVLRFRDNARHAADTWYEARLYDGGATLERGYTLSVTWTRAPYWEAPEDIVQVKTRSMAAFADFAQITNCEDSNPANSNVLRLAAPAGDVPTPIRIRIQNDYPTGRLAQVRMHWSPEIINPTLEPGQADPLPAFQPDVRASDGSYGYAKEFIWTVLHTTTRNYTGMFRVLVNGRLFGAWTARVGYELKRGRDAHATVDGLSGWTDFGLFYLPPRGYTRPVRYPFKVWLTSEDDREGSVDFVLLAPVYNVLQQWRYLIFDGFNAIEGTCIEDDMRRMDEPPIYEYDGQKWPIVNAVGGPIELWPGGLPGNGTQCMVFALQGDATGGSRALRTAQVQVYARARYANLP